MNKKKKLLIGGAVGIMSAISIFMVAIITLLWPFFVVVGILAGIASFASPPPGASPSAIGSYNTAQEIISKGAALQALFQQETSGKNNWVGGAPNFTSLLIALYEVEQGNSKLSAISVCQSVGDINTTGRQAAPVTPQVLQEISGKCIVDSEYQTIEQLITAQQKVFPATKAIVNGKLVRIPGYTEYIFNPNTLYCGATTADTLGTYGGGCNSLFTDIIKNRSPGWTITDNSAMYAALTEFYIIAFQQVALSPNVVSTYINSSAYAACGGSFNDNLQTVDLCLYTEYIGTTTSMFQSGNIVGQNYIESQCPPSVPFSPMTLSGTITSPFGARAQLDSRLLGGLLIARSPAGVRWPGEIVSSNGTTQQSYPYDYHAGIDIGVPYGGTIYAATGGIVRVNPYDQAGFGQSLLVYSGCQPENGTNGAVGGLVILYGHVSPLPNIHTGTPVVAGQPIATVVETPDETGGHVYVAEFLYFQQAFRINGQNGTIDHGASEEPINPENNPWFPPLQVSSQ